jgi:filamentous hemagglutinin family protein
LVTVAGSTKSNTILNWVDFGGTAAIGNGAKTELIQFNLPTSDSAVLNKVSTGTTTLGAKASLSSNGNIYLYNPNGIIINSGATINAANFVASTINDSDVDAKFASDGTLSYTGATAGTLTNSGTITTVNGSGSVILAGKSLTIDGTVTGNLTVRAINTGDNISLSNVTALVVQKDVVTGNGGDLTVLSNGGNIDVAVGAGLVTNVQGNATLDTRGTASLTNGSIGDTAVAGGIAVASTKTLEIITGGNLFASGDVTLNGTGNNVGTLKLTNADDVVFVDADNVSISTSALTGSLDVTSTAGSIASSGAVSMAAGKTVSLTAATAGKSITFQGSGALTIAAAIAPTISITTDGNLVATAANLDNGVGAQNVTNLTLKSTAGTVVANTAIDVANAGTVTVEGYNGVTTGTISGKTIGITSANGTATLGTISGLAAAGSAATINVKGNIALPAVGSIDSLTVASSNGAITQGVGNVLNGNLVGGSVNGSFTALNEITLTTAFNNFNYLKLVNTTASKAVQVVDANGGLNLNNGTSVVGDLTITANDGNATADDFINLGVLAADVISTAKTTLVNNASASDIVAIAKNITMGELNLTAGRDVTFAVASASTTLGTIKGTVARNLTLNEQSALDFGALTVFGNLVATSTVGITDSAAFTVTGTSSFDLATNTGDITLDAGNTFTGAVTFGTSTKAANVYLKSVSNLIIAGGTATGTLGLETTGATTITQTGAINATGVTTLKNAAGAGVVTLTNAANKFSTVTLAVAGTGAVGVTDSDSTLVVDGTTAGALTVNAAGSLTYNASATNVTVGLNTTAAGDITVNGAITGAGGNALTATTNNGKVILGSFYNQSGGFTANTTNTAGKAIEDLDGVRANIYGDVTLNTKGGTITFDNFTNINTSPTVGHRFGGITANTVNGSAAGANISIAEGGTIRIVSLTSGTAGNVSLTATATDAEIGTVNTSSIVGTAAGTTINVGGNLTLNAKDSISIAPNAAALTDGAAGSAKVGGNLYALANFSAGSVTLGTANTVTNAFTVAGFVNVVAGQTASLFSSAAEIKLGATAGVGSGDFYVGKNLSIDSAGKITEVSGLKLSTSASSTPGAAASVFKAAGAVDLSTGTNAFGKLDIQAAGQAVTIKEAGTMNFANVAAGSLTATADGGDIIDTQIGGVGSIVVTGATTLTANNIALDIATNNFASGAGTGVKLVTSGDATLVDAGGLLLLGGTYVGGKGSFTSTGTISDFGVLKIVGTLYLESSSAGAAISLTNPANEFGTITFKSTGTGTTMIVESATIKLGTGLQSGVGAVTLQSVNGEILTDSTLTGGSNFAGAVTLYSNDNVTVTHPWTIAGLFTINTPAGKVVDLGGISKLANLGGVAPTVVGGTLKAGTPTP